MVNLTSIRRLIDCGDYSHLIDETDYKNIDNLITHRQDVFNDKRLMDGIILVQEYSNNKPVEKKYGVIVSQPTGVGQWQSVTKKIYDNKFLDYLLSVKNIIFNSNGEIEEEIIFFESVPIFNESIEMIQKFVSDLLEVDHVPNLSEFLSNVDGLCEDDELNHDYFLRQIYLNYKSKTAKLVLYKLSDNDNNLKTLVEKIATNKTSKFWANANGIAGCCSGYFCSPDIISGLMIEVDSAGLVDKVGYIAQPAQNTKFIDNKFSSIQQDSEQYLLSETCRWSWIPEDHAEQLSRWPNDSRFANLLLGFQIETTSKESISRIIYGNNG